MADFGRQTEIALYGFYRYGNFGDDLAGTIFGRYLREHGVKVRIYGLCREYADAFGFTVAETVEELLDGVDGVVLGGGSMLVSRRRPSWLNFGMLAHLPEVMEAGEKLVILMRSRKIPFFCLSVGGDGRFEKPLYPPYKRKFLESAEFISVRNRSDLAVLENHGRTGVYYPDIIWQTASFFPSAPKRKDRITVGVNLYPSNVMGLNLLYIPALWRIIRLRPDVDFVFMETANARQNRFGAIALPSGRNVQRYMFHDLKEDLEMISSLHLVVSSRLHLGVAAMSYGVPFLSVSGEGKTKTFFREAGRPEMCFDRGDIPRLIRLFRDPRHWEQFVEDPVLPDISALRAESAGHLEQLKRIVSSI